MLNVRPIVRTFVDVFPKNSYWYGTLSRQPTKHHISSEFVSIT